MPASPTLSIVVPCYNEQAVLPEFLRRVNAVAGQIGFDYEVVLVDDGSRDATWRIIKMLPRRTRASLGSA